MTDVLFRLVTETKGALRYQEHASAGTPLEGDDAQIGTLYFRKATFGKISAAYASTGKPPASVRLSVIAD